MNTVSMRMSNVDFINWTATVEYQFEAMEKPVKLLRVPIKGFLKNRLTKQSKGESKQLYYDTTFNSTNDAKLHKLNPLRLTFFVKDGKHNGCRISHVKDMCHTRKITDLHGRTLDTGLWMEHTPDYFRRVEVINVKS